MQKANSAPPKFVQRERLTTHQAHPDWDILIGDGPVIATAIHDGHAMRPSLEPHLALGAEDRRREEDPLTGVLTSVGDVRIRLDTSRFQVDLNRPIPGACRSGMRLCPSTRWNARWPDTTISTRP